MLRLGFHYHVPMCQDADGNLKTPGYLGVFLDHLAAQCEMLTCFLHSPLSHEVPHLDYTLRASNVQWVDIGPHSAFPIRVLRTRAIMGVVKKWRGELDVLLIRGPSPLLPAIAGAVGGLPTSLLLVGDYQEGIDDINQPRWIREILRVWARWNHHQQMKVTRRSLTFVNSHKLYNELRPYVENLVETRTTTLTSADFYEREDTCMQRPVRLLYTGRMAHAKGLLHMVEALALLVQRGEDVVLDLVGWPQKGDPILDEVQALAREKGIADRVFYHGYKPVGPELFAYYKQADIYVIASTFEGFPRTVWEAMAHSLPVVATRVGSIPMFLEAGKTVMLVEPENAFALAQGISLLLKDKDLYSTLINQGYILARQNTLEERAVEIVDHLASWLESSG